MERRGRSGAVGWGSRGVRLSRQRGGGALSGVSGRRRAGRDTKRSGGKLKAYVKPPLLPILPTPWGVVRLEW